MNLSDFFQYNSNSIQLSYNINNSMYCFMKSILQLLSSHLSVCFFHMGYPICLLLFYYHCFCCNLCECCRLMCDHINFRITAQTMPGAVRPARASRAEAPSRAIQHPTGPPIRRPLLRAFQDNKHTHSCTEILLFTHTIPLHTTHTYTRPYLMSSASAVSRFDGASLWKEN